MGWSRINETVTWQEAPCPDAAAAEEMEAGMAVIKG
jgi:hypothetical protein